jgi:hypothetical protein
METVSQTYLQSPSEAKRHNASKPILLDATSREKILKVLEDERIDNFVAEFRRCREAESTL